MRTIADVEAILMQVLAAEKAAGNSATSILSQKELKIPEYYEGYKLAIEQKKRIRAHSDPDYFPADLFKSSAPSQTQEEVDYIKNNYECTTFPVWGDFVQTIGRALIDNNWSIKYPKEEPKFVDYVQSGIETYGSIESYIKTILVELKLKDPNGIIAIRPKSFDVVNVTDEEGKEYKVVDDTKPFKPIPIYFPCERVVAKDAGKWYMVLTTDKTEIESGGKPQKIGRVFELYDENAVWRIEQTGKATTPSFYIYPWYTHDYKKVPATELKGVPRLNEDGSIFWQSPFYGAVGLLNLSLVNRNTIQAPIRRLMFPMPVMEGDECDFSDEDYTCFRGILDGEGVRSGKKCSQCGGTGIKNRISPYGALLYKRPSKLDQEPSGSSTPLQYVSPPTESSKFVLDVVDIDEAKARDILHLKPASTFANKITAEEIKKDDKAMHAFVLPSSNQLFDLYQFVLDATEFQFLNREEFPRVELTYPSSFDFKTEGDYLEELKFAREAGVPDIVIHALVYRLISNMFFTEGETAKAFEVLVLADRLMAMSPEVVSLRKAQGTITNAELLIHDSGLTLVNRLMMEDPDWINKDIEVKLQSIRTLAEKLSPEPTNTLTRLALGE